MSDSFIRKSGKWVVPPPPREHRCEFPGAAKTFPNGVVWACACGTAWTSSEALGHLGHMDMDDE